MRRGIDHVPVTERRELERIVEMILDEFDDVLSLAQRDWRTNGRIDKIVLYGSYARGEWVDEHFTRVGKHSDWDLIIIVNDERLANRSKYWQNVTERLSREYEITHRLRSPVQYFVYTMDQINTSLENGRYFFTDIIRDGVIIYEKDDSDFSLPQPLPPSDEYSMSKRYFDEWFRGASQFYGVYEFSFGNGWLKNAAYQLHQCVEKLYQTALLVYTLYTPHSRNVVELRRLAEKFLPNLIQAWPRDEEEEIAAFEQLQHAYVKGDYPLDYEIAEDRLAWLGERTRLLSDLIRAGCEAHLATLKASADR